MTQKDFWKIEELYILPHILENNKEAAGCLMELLNAADKQLPKKLHKIRESYYECPICCTVYPRVTMMPEWRRYCQVCGQKFDYEGWEVKEN